METHPLPALSRPAWTNLNGAWNFCFDDADQGLHKQWQNGFPKQYTIQVPFCYQSAKSGVHIVKEHDVLWYSRSLELTELPPTLLLHFGAVDYACTVWVNGSCAGMHMGGSTHFFLDIAPYARQGANLLVVRVKDTFSCEIPRGKQCWDETLTRCWYTPTSGIWRGVWLEATGRNYITKLLITPDLDRGCAVMELVRNADAPCQAEVEVTFQGQICCACTASLQKSSTTLVLSIREEDPIDDLHCWSPENPNLYEVRVRLLAGGCLSDEVKSYFGMRKIECRNGKIFLNDKELFLRLVLDQGYWPDTLMTPPDEQALKEDIRWTKEMGFNGARKHQKMEDPRFYYWADRMGLLVWGECPSAYEFNRNTTENLLREWPAFIEEHYNDPCIITWVPFNESWGVRRILTDARQQAQAAAFYQLTKALDQTRLVSTNDGWETIEQSDIIGIHDYEADPKKFHARYQELSRFWEHGIGYKQPICHGHTYRGQPFMITEYGGIAFADGLQESWGYHEKAADPEAFLRRLDNISRELQSLDYCCGFCYTQLTDVMQETNGLLTAARKPKVDTGRLAEIFSRRNDEQKP